MTRWGFCAYLATLTTTLTELTERCKGHPPQEEDTTTLSNLLEQFNRKKEIISGLDEKILAFTDEKDLEVEIVESEEALSSISLHITQVKCLLSPSIPPLSSRTTGHSGIGKEHSPSHK